MNQRPDTQTFTHDLTAAPGGSQAIERAARLSRHWPDLPATGGIRITHAVLEQHRREAAALRGEAIRNAAAAIAAGARRLMGGHAAPSHRSETAPCCG